MIPGEFGKKYERSYKTAGLFCKSAHAFWVILLHSAAMFTSVYYWNGRCPLTWAFRKRTTNAFHAKLFACLVIYGLKP